MQTLLAGQNVQISGNALVIAVQWRSGVDIDLSAYLLGENGKVSGDADMVFYGQTSDGSGAVAFAPGASGGSFRIDLGRVRPGADRIAVCAAVDAAASAGKTMAAAMPVEVTASADGGGAFAEFAPTFGETKFTAVILCEAYRHKGAWKLRASGQGFEGGLKPLSEMFGIEIAAEPAPAPTPAPAPAAARPTPAPAPAAAPPISLSKISLTKAKPSVDLTKRGGSFGTVAINLNWNRQQGQPAPKKGLFGLSRGSGGIDLDVGCLYELADGSIGGVQALGNVFGALDRPPYVRLSGDDRTGASTEGEWLHVNGGRWDQIRRILVFAFIYEGVPNWASTDGVVTLTAEGQPPVEVRMDETSGLGMCAVVLLENVSGQLRVNREVKYFKGHQDMDRAYSWGLKYQSGSKN